MTTRREFLRRTVAAGVAAALAESVRGAPDTDRARATRTGTAQTVLGAIDASELGFTLAHEHLSSAPGVLERWPKDWGGRQGLVTRAVDRLGVLGAAGVRTVVDLTPYDVGRDIRFLEEVSRQSGMNIIACTGQRFLPPSGRLAMPSRTIGGLAEFFKKEIDRGIDGTSIKAGVIKIGVGSNRPTSLEAVGLRAAARASKATGVPIRVHTHAAERPGEAVAAILEEEGLDPSRVSLDHSDDSGDLDFLSGMAKRGYSLGMDHLHRGLLPDGKPSFDRRAECIKAMIDAGFAGKLFLSTDSMFGGSLLPEETREWRENLDPPEGMLFVAHNLLPRLREMGVTNQHIQVMTVENPQAFFARRAST